MSKSFSVIALSGVIGALAAGLAAGTPAAAPPQEAASPAPLALGDSLPIDGACIFDQVVYLPVRVGSAGPYPFVLDTGAGSTSALDSGLADSLGLGAASLTDQGGGAGEEAVLVGMLTSQTLTLGGREFTLAPALTLPLRRLDPHWGKRKDGLVGADILAGFLTCIDYERERVVLRAPAAAATLPGTRIPLRIDQGYLFVEAELLLHGSEAPLPALLLVDTGLRMTTFTRPFAEANALAAQCPRRVTGVVGFGIGGLSQGVIGRLRGLRLGPLEIASPVVAFSLDTGGVLAAEDFAGILGADVLSRFHLAFDYGGSQLILAPNAGFAVPSEFDMSGIRFAMPGERFERLEVFAVYADSPAAEAGLQPGDKVLAIDGRPAASFTRETLRIYLQREGATVALTTERAGQPRLVTLRLRRLV